MWFLLSCDWPTPQLQWTYLLHTQSTLPPVNRPGKCGCLWIRAADLLMVPFLPLPLHYLFIFYSQRLISDHSILHPIKHFISFQYALFMYVSFFYSLTQRHALYFFIFFLSIKYTPLVAWQPLKGFFFSFLRCFINHLCWCMCVSLCSYTRGDMFCKCTIVAGTFVHVGTLWRSLPTERVFWGLRVS